MAPSRASSSTSTSPAGGGRELLGGKGVGLAEMTALGLPVPAGFTITTDACRAYMAGRRPAGGARGGGRGARARGSRRRPASASATPADPLLVSVRSGAAISMPGMMDTILNLGLNDEAVEGLARAHGQPALRLRLLPAADPDVRRGRRRDRRARFEDALTALKRERGAALDTDLDADDLARARRAPTARSTASASGGDVPAGRGASS